MRLYIIHTYMPIYKFPFRKFNCTLVVYMLNQVYLKAASHDGQKCGKRGKGKGYYLSFDVRCWRKKSDENMSVSMQNRSKIFPQTIIIIMRLVTKKKHFCYLKW